MGPHAVRYYCHSGSAGSIWQVAARLGCRGRLLTDSLMLPASRFLLPDRTRFAMGGPVSLTSGKVLLASSCAKSSGVKRPEPTLIRNGREIVRRLAGAFPARSIIQ